ncbi:hypothetical protein F4703DRAFT_1970026 [Phycomyces blakesleeanus]
MFPIDNKLQRSGHFTSLEGESSLGPDTKFYKTIDGIRLDCLLIEVKCPNSTSDDDLFKLSIEMQYTLNRLVEHGVDNPDVYGVLVYKPRCSEDFHVIINTMSSFFQLRNLVCEQMEYIEENRKKISSSINWIHKPIIHIK